MSEGGSVSAFPQARSDDRKNALTVGRRVPNKRWIELPQQMRSVFCLIVFLFQRRPGGVFEAA